MEGLHGLSFTFFPPVYCAPSGSSDLSLDFLCNLWHPPSFWFLFSVDIDHLPIGPHLKLGRHWSHFWVAGNPLHLRTWRWDNPENERPWLAVQRLFTRSSNIARGPIESLVGWWPSHHSDWVRNALERNTNVNLERNTMSAVGEILIWFSSFYPQQQYCPGSHRVLGWLVTLVPSSYPKLILIPILPGDRTHRVLGWWPSPTSPYPVISLQNSMWSGWKVCKSHSRDHPNTRFWLGEKFLCEFREKYKCQFREKYKCQQSEKYSIDSVVICFERMELDFSCCAEDLNPFLPG